MRIPYEQLLNRKPDFEVTYRIYTKEEGGRHSLPFQGIRWDFKYEEHHPDHSYYMIYPEFLNVDGTIFEEQTPIPIVGRAYMWISNPTLQSFHRERIKPGTRAFFMEGPTKVGVCEVIGLIGLRDRG